MSESILAVAPIFLLIVLGYGLRRGSVPSLEFWNLNDKLVYWVLLPALLFYKTSRLDISLEMLGNFSVVIYSGFFSAVILSMLLGKLLGFSSPAITSILQGSARHNTFIALAIAESLFGTQGLSMAALGSALLIPMTNVVVITLMVWQLHSDSKLSAIVAATLKDLARNPLILAVSLGLTFNYLGFKEVPILHEMTRILGGAALPVVLMCVGANIRVRAMAASWVPVMISSCIKMLLFPLIIVTVSVAIGLDTMQTTIAVLFGAAPTGANSYTLARQMGGDAPLMAAIVTIQTALAVISLPVTIELVRGFLGS
ncbi:MAG: AEC family transporter [Arenicella sp.]